VSGLDQMTERLYDLDRAELRRLAWEALLIADGPAHIPGPSSSGTATIVCPVNMDGRPAFMIWDNPGVTR
jgi:hypothetical protein